MPQNEVQEMQKARAAAGAGCEAVLAGRAELWQGWHCPWATGATGLIATSSASCGQRVV